MNEAKSYPINFTFCARCGEQMRPHDASAVKQMPEPSTLASVMCYSPEFVAQIKEVLQTIDYTIKVGGDIANGSQTHQKIKSIRLALGYNTKLCSASDASASAKG